MKWPISRVYFWAKMAMAFRRKKNTAAAAAKPRQQNGPRTLQFSRQVPPEWSP